MLEGFGPQILTSVMVKAGANCETFWRVKSMFTHLHVMPMTLFRLHKARFSIRPSREALAPKVKSGLIVNLLAPCHPKKTQGLVKKHPVGPPHTYLDVVQEKKIEDYWNVDSSICQTPGEDLRHLLCWKRNLQKDTCGLGKNWHRFERLPDQIMYGQKFGRTLVKPLRIEKSRNGQKRNRSLTMFEAERDYFIDLDDKG